MKKSRKVGAAAPKSPQQSAAALLALAQGQAAAGRWREATAAFKDLLKIEDRPEWRLELAAAYAGRARELAAKGMPKEALTLWENRALVAPQLPPELDYCALLLRQGKVQAVLDLLAQAGGRLDGATLTALRSHLAALHLAGETAVAAGLPADDPIRALGLTAAAALDAYCRGDDAALQEALAAIPFRSPYRDLAQVLKALQRAPAAPAEAAALLERVGDDSGFAPLRRACALALGPPETLPARLADAGEQTRRFALTLAGWGDERQALWEETRRVGGTGPQALLRLLQRRRALLGEDWARRQALRLLVPGFPKSAALITEGGGRRLSPDERLLVTAWHAEESPNPWEAIEAWEAYADHLIEAGPGPAGSDAALRVALVLRRVDSHRDILAGVAPSQDPDSPDRDLANALALSLTYDPDDRDTYERLVRYYLRGDRLKDARPLLEQGLKRFPKDLGLLTAAMDAALAGDAFKKAARYAHEILALDPINSGARERLVKAHLAHTRKQVRAARYDLARKELDEAGQWDQDGRRREQRALLAGLLDLIEDESRGRDALRAQFAALGDGLAAALALTLEAVAIGRTAAWALKAAGSGKPQAPTQADLSAFLARLRAHLEGGEGLATELQRLFDKPLSVAAKWPLTLAESEAACDTLRRAGLTLARQAFAVAALKRWPHTPVFVLHQFESRRTGRRSHPDRAEMGQLEDAWIRARAAGDERTAHRIEQVIDQYAPPPFFPGLPGGFFTDAFDDDDDGPGPDLGQLPIPPDAAMRAIIEIMGIDQVLKIAGLSAQERAEFKRRERELGRARMIDEVLELMREELPDFGTGMPPAPGPGGRGAPPRGGPKGKRQTPRATDTKPPSDDDPEQFELF
ncbi:hypothetical protein [uncultured Thiodictyon sp.]|jgi:hypothetical protein|uniref:hypothetical protein n=1 Tax=uncultured Thiodictyon sp. TaxID=1846217 RepID=UPI0025E33940|nr:hypothetical protein [uncultured Thiodictyon sp.]